MRKLVIFSAVAIFILVAVAALGGAFSSPKLAASSPRPRPVTAPAQSTPEQLAKAAKCKSVLQGDHSGIWKHYDVSGSTITVEVGSAYYMADYDTKNVLNKVMVCVATQGRMDNSIDLADYIDPQTHKTVAEWTPALGLDVK